MNRATIVLLLFLPILAFLLDRQGVLDPAKGVAIRIVTPVTQWLVSATATISDGFRTIGSLRQIVTENDRLQKENQELHALLADAANIRHENDLLRGELALEARPTGVTEIAALVVGRTSAGAFGTLLLNRGTTDGVRVGSVVISRGALMGRVTEVYETTCVVTPITNVNSVIPVVLVASRGSGILRGGVRGLTIEEVSRDVTVEKDEAVVTSGLAGMVAAGIFIGRVEAVTSTPADIFQTVSVASDVRFNSLELVVIRP
jgi:rod shape-determining protein MreC